MPLGADAKSTNLSDGLADVVRTAKSVRDASSTNVAVKAAQLIRFLQTNSESLKESQTFRVQFQRSRQTMATIVGLLAVLNGQTISRLREI